MSDVLRESLSITFVGLVIVFVMLAMVSIAVSLMRRLDQRWQASEKQTEAEASEQTQTIDETTLVLIAAAVSTVIQGRFHIRTVRRIFPARVSGTWSQQGRAVLHGSHVVPRKR